MSKKQKPLEVDNLTLPALVRLMSIKAVWGFGTVCILLIGSAFTLGYSIADKFSKFDVAEQARKTADAVARVDQVNLELERQKRELDQKQEALDDYLEKDQFLGIYNRYLRCERDLLACTDESMKGEFVTSREQAEHAIETWFLGRLRERRLIYKKTQGANPSVIFADGTTWYLPDSVKSLNCAAMLAQLAKAEPGDVKPKTNGKILLLFP